MDGSRQNILQFDPDRRKEELPELEQFVKGVLSTLKELSAKNEELKRASAELQAALKQARQKSQEQDDQTTNLEVALRLANEKSQELKERNDDLMVAFKLANEKNHELDEANAQLLAALQHANERVGQLEQSAVTEERRYRSTLDKAAGMLSQAADEMEALARAEESHDRDRWIGMKSRSQELRAHASHLLEGPAGTAAADNSESVEQDQPLESAAESEPVADNATAQEAATEDAPPTQDAGRVESPEARLMEMLKSGLAEISATSAPSEESVAISPSSLEAEPQVDETINKLQDQLYRLMRRLSPTPEEASFEPEEHREDAPAKAVPISPATAEPEMGCGEPAIKNEAQSTTTSIDLVASPFENYSGLAEFHKAIKQLPGVVDVIAHGLEGGTLRLEVVYAGSGPLADLLMELSRFDLRLVSVGDRRIEVRILDTSGAS